MNPCVLSLCLAAGLAGQAPDMPAPAPGLVPTPVPGPMLIPVPAQPAITTLDTPITPGAFAQAFQPVAGKYEVVFIHPDTCCPIRVCFELPCGCCAKVSCGRRTLTFDYGRHKVVIRFKLIGGGVRVRYT